MNNDIAQSGRNSLFRTAFSNWIGPALGALILVGGYAGYDQWNKKRDQEQKCGKMKRQFESNANMLATEMIDRVGKTGDRSAALTLSDGVMGNEILMNQLDIDCPGWITHKYE